MLVLATGLGLLLLARAGRTLNAVASQRPLETVQVQATDQLDALLARVAGLDPTICHLLGRALNNRWGPWYGSVLIDPQSTGTSDALLTWVDNAEIEARHVPSLRAGLSHADFCVRRTSAQLMGRARVPDLSLLLRNELNSDRAGTREAALLALGHFDKPSSYEPAREALRDTDVSVRVAAAWAIGQLEQREAVDALTDVARDPDVRMRRTVAWALGAIEDPSAVAVLSAMLSDPEPGVRIQAAHALGAIEHPSAAPPLMRLLESDRDPQVRRAAAAALGKISG
jgi:HEAT repeat protein